MKYIEIPSLTALSTSLSHEGPECSVSVRLEAYSCKKIKRDKRLFRDLERVYWDDMGILEGIKYEPGEDGTKSSPSSSSSSFLAQARSSLSTPFGPLGSPQSRKTLYLLIATLNVAFPDYTFDSVKPSSFVHLQNGAQILHALSSTMVASRTVSGAYGAYPAAQGLGFGVAQGSPGSPYEFVKESPYASSSVASSTHPEVYALLDEVIGPLDECEVYEYAPEPEEDPNAGEGDDDDDVEEVEEEYSVRDEHIFSLDEDISLTSTPTPNAPHTPRGAALASTDHPLSPFHESYRPRPSSPLPRLAFNRPHSAFWPSSYLSTAATGSNPLLWSSHWFFFNRKQKRILYVSVWARKRSLSSILRNSVEGEYLVRESGPIPRTAQGRRLRHFSESDESDGSPVSTKFSSKSQSLEEKERFLAWDGAVGAGARALGLDD